MNATGTWNTLHNTAPDAASSYEMLAIDNRTIGAVESQNMFFADNGFGEFVRTSFPAVVRFWDSQFVV